MALSRKFLKEVLKEYDNADDMIEEIIEAHAETVASIKDEMETLKKKHGGKSYEELHAELASAEAEIERIKAEAFDENGVSWKIRAEEMGAKRKAAEDEHKRMCVYRAQEKAYLSMLSECGIPYKYRELIAKANKATICGLVIDGGKIKDAEQIMDSIRAEYAEFADGSGANRSITHIGDRAERIAARRQQRDVFE